MSRYSVPTQDPCMMVVVGWDTPLMTFFAQVFDHAIAEEVEACVLWIGTTPAAIPTVAALQAQLAGWAMLSADIMTRLTRDQQAATPPMPPQRWAHHHLYNAGEPSADQAPPAASARPAPPRRLRTPPGRAVRLRAAPLAVRVVPHRLTCGKRTSSCMASTWCGVPACHTGDALQGENMAVERERRGGRG